ncbi:MAG TPA: low molecular weight protein-tyrosine-phosphatase [Longimicrobiales bacterium]
MQAEPIRVLFICQGNICRSPLAEAVFRARVRAAGLEARFEIDSAGTSDYHEGERADPRSAAVARSRGIELTSRSRPVTESDVRRFDYLIVMDGSNLRDVRRVAARVRPDAPLYRLREFDPSADGDLDVPDPYYGGPAGFERVQEIVERACEGLLAHIRESRRL